MRIKHNKLMSHSPWKTPYIAIIFPVILLIGYLLTGTASAAAANILLLTSYHQGHPWSDRITEGVYSAFFESDIPHRIFTEHMDGARFSEPPHLERFTQWLRFKYSNTTLDTIIAVDNIAIEYLQKIRDDLFNDTPVIFCGDNRLPTVDFEKSRNFFNITKSPDLLETANLIKRLHPNTRQIVAVIDHISLEQQLFKELETLQSTPADDIRFTILDRLSSKGFINRISQLSEGDILFYLATGSEAERGTSENIRIFKRISSQCRVPIYSVWDDYLGHGLLGGKLVSGVDQGRAAARMSIKIINGEDPEQLPRHSPGMNRFMFDFDELRHFSIDSSQLPKKSTIINQPLTISEHKTILALFLGGIIGLHFIIFFLVLNILKRRRAEEDILKAQQRFNTILESAKEGFVEIDVDAKVQDVNPEMCIMLGRSRQEIIGQSITTYLTDDSSDHLRHYLKMSLAGPRYTFEVTIMQPQENHLTCLFNMTPILDEQQIGIGCFAMVSDITELKNAQQALEKNEEILRATFESTEDGLLVVAHDASITHVNTKFIQMWNIVADKIRWDSPQHLLKHMQNSLERSEEFGIKIGSLQKKPAKSIEMLKLRNGHILERFSCPLILDNLEAGRVWSFRDITEKKELESQLLQAQKMEAIGNLAGGIAHDFNNRLQTISGYTQLLIHDPDRSKTDLTKLTAIQRSVRSSCELIDQLLMFSRKIESKLTPTDLNREVIQIQKLLERTIPRMIHIQLKLDPNLGIINADPAQIEQVIMNLSINASHAMPAGGRLAILTENLSLNETFCKQNLGATPGDFVRLRVKDSGVGMTKQIIDHIFEPFFTTKFPGKGTGLGLSMVHGIIKNHKGFIACKSIPNQGTIFDIYFPMLKMDTATMTLHVSEETKMIGGCESILMIDDDADNLDVGKTMLERFGYTVLTAIDSKGALKQFISASNRIDLTVLDLNMPGTGGQPILRTILGIDPDAKVLIASGFSGLAVKHALAAGAAGYIRKPFEMKELLNEVRKLIDQKPEVKNINLNEVNPDAIST